MAKIAREELNCLRDHRKEPKTSPSCIRVLISDYFAFRALNHQKLHVSVVGESYITFFTGVDMVTTMLSLSSSYSLFPCRFAAKKDFYNKVGDIAIFRMPVAKYTAKEAE